MKITKLIVKTNSEKYPIIIGHNLIKNLPNFLKNYLLPSNKYLLIIDKNIPSSFISIVEKSLKNRNIYKFFFNANESDAPLISS